MALPATDPASRLEALLDRAEPELRTALMNAFAAATSASTIEELIALIEAGRVDEAIQVAANAGAIRIADGYAAVFTISGRNTAEFLEDVLELVVGFDQVNTRAVRVMQRERLRLISNFTAEQRNATRSALIEGIRRGDNPVDQARNFRNSIGITDRQQRAVDNYRRLLQSGSSEALQRELRDRRFDRTVRRAIRTGEPLTQEQIDRMVERYAERTRAFRARTIARTEALRAVHQGSEEMYNQAIEQGVLNSDQLLRTWHDADDRRVRSSHNRLDGLQRRIGETFPGDDGPLRFPGDPEAPASETVQCRCVLSTRIEAPPE